MNLLLHHWFFVTLPPGWLGAFARGCPTTTLRSAKPASE